MFIILTGSSGVGKNTVITEIEKRHDNFKLMPTYTTRDKRPNEVDGYPFYYITKDEFQQKIKEGELIEYEHIHNNFYGSSYKILNDNLKEDIVLIKDLGIEGAQNLTHKISSITPVKKIFLTTTKHELKRRLKGRGEKQIKLRLKRYKREQKEINKFDYIIYNYDLDETCNFIRDIYDKELDEILPTKVVDKISIRKVNKYVSKLQTGKILKPVQVQIENGDIYIIKGHEKFIAGILTNKLVAKVIVKGKKINKLEPAQIMEWKSLIHDSEHISEEE